MAWLFGVQEHQGCRKKPSHQGNFPLATRDMFYAFSDTPGPEAEVSTSQDPF